MNITILCSDKKHPVLSSLQYWSGKMVNKGHVVSIHHEMTDLNGGDILFLVSCSQFINYEKRSKYKSTLVLHASDLPDGRGWSPHIWAIINGATEITVSLLEADDAIDSGPIWLKEKFKLEGHELLPEINAKLFHTELSLMTQAVEQFDCIKPVSQTGNPGKYMPKRSVADSQLDPDKTIAEQFNLLRVVDSERYPAFFNYKGQRYLIRIEKSES